MRLAVVIAAAIALGAAQSPPAQPRLVTIDVVASDARGRAVEDLKPSDFEVREEGAAIALESVRTVRRADAAVRSFAIYLDEYHVQAGANSARLRDALLAFLDTVMTANDQVAVMKPLDSVLAIRTTRDRAAARSAVEAFEGRRGDYTAKNAYERDYIAGTAARIEGVRDQVALSALNALAVHLGTLGEGRKTLIVASETIGHVEHRRGQEYLPTPDTIVRSANRANVAIYAVDPTDDGSGVAPSDTLRRLTDDTDGALIRDDVAAGLRRAAADAGAYYLLSFRTAHPDDGRFRALQTRVARKGVALRARKGYWTTSPDEALRAALIAKANEPKKVVPPEPAPHVSPLIRPWIGVARGDGGKTRVTFVWEPSPRVPGDRSRVAAARLLLTAKLSDGTVVYEGPIAPTGPAAMDDPAARPARAVFEVPPGRIRLRMAIEDAASNVIDQDVREMSIRDLRGDVAVGTPEILRARNAREFRTLEDDAAVPVAAREFSRTEHLLIRFSAYPPGDGATVSARLLGRTGAAIRSLEVGEGTRGGRAIDLPLAGFASGEYVIEVRATSGARDASDRVTFRVTS